MNAGTDDPLHAHVCCVSHSFSGAQGQSMASEMTQDVAPLSCFEKNPAAIAIANAIHVFALRMQEGARRACKDLFASAECARSGRPSYRSVRCGRESTPESGISQRIRTSRAHLRERRRGCASNANMRLASGCAQDKRRARGKRRRNRARREMPASFPKPDRSRETGGNAQLGMTKSAVASEGCRKAFRRD